MRLFDRFDYVLLAIIVGIWLLAVWLWPREANAQLACGPSIQVLLSLDRLGEIEHETMKRDDVIWIMWLNTETGSWTLTGTQGPITCMFAGGRNGYAGQTIADYLIGPAL